MFKHIAQRDYALEFAVLINDHEAVHARPPDRVVYRRHVVVQRAGEDAREILQKLDWYSFYPDKLLTSERFSKASPTVRFRSSYTPPLMSAMTSTASNTLSTVPVIVSHASVQPRRCRTSLIQDGNARYALLDKHVNDVHDWCVH